MLLLRPCPRSCAVCLASWGWGRRGMQHPKKSVCLVLVKESPLCDGKPGEPDPRPVVCGTPVRGTSSWEGAGRPAPSQRSHLLSSPPSHFCIAPLFGPTPPNAREALCACVRAGACMIMDKSNRKGEAPRKERGQGARGARGPPPPPTFAGLPVGDGLAHVAVVALLAVVAVAAGRVVAAVEADAPALAPRQLVELHVEAAAPGVQVAAAGCGGAGRASGGGTWGPETAPKSPLLHRRPARQSFPESFSSAPVSPAHAPGPPCGARTTGRSPFPGHRPTRHTRGGRGPGISLCPNPACQGLYCASPIQMLP